MSETNSDTKTNPLAPPTRETTHRLTRRDFLGNLGKAALVFGGLHEAPILRDTQAGKGVPPAERPEGAEEEYIPNVEFAYSEGVDEKTKREVEEAILFADRYFYELGIRLPERVQVSAIEKDFYINSSGNSIRISLENPAWRDADSIKRKRIATHEYAHTVQSGLTQGTSRIWTPLWMDEGMAEVWSEDALIRNGDLTLAELVYYRLEQYFKRNASNLPPLQEYESSENDFTWDVYNMSVLALRILISEKGVEAFAEFCSQIPEVNRGVQITYDERGLYVRNDNWKRAFENAFGIPADDFYNQFGQIRTANNFPVPEMSGSDENIEFAIPIIDRYDR